MGDISNNTTMSKSLILLAFALVAISSALPASHEYSVEKIPEENFAQRDAEVSELPGTSSADHATADVDTSPAVLAQARRNRFQAFRNRFKKRAGAHGTGRAFLKALFKRYRNKAFMRKLSGRSNRFKAFRNRFMKRVEPPGKGRKFLKALFKKYRGRNHGSRNRFKAFRNRFMKRSAAPGRGRAFLKALFKKYRMRHGAVLAQARRNRFQAFRNRFKKRAGAHGTGRAF